MNWEDGEFYRVSVAVGKSRRYHAKMRAFYQGCHDLTMAANALAGSGTFIALLGGTQTVGVAKWLAGIVAIAATLNTILKFPSKARRHDLLCQRFTDLAAKIVEWAETDDNLRKAKSSRLRIERDEPTERRLIDIQSENEELRSRGVPERKLVPLSLLQRHLGYVATFGLSRLELWLKSQQDIPDHQNSEPYQASLSSPRESQ